jgi:hypothetical protein
MNSTAVKKLNPATIEMAHNLPSDCDIVDEAFKRYRVLINLAVDTNTADRFDAGELTKLQVTVTDPRCGAEMYPSFGDNETCTYV